jgi:hypothetical protein
VYGSWGVVHGVATAWWVYVGRGRQYLELSLGVKQYPFASIQLLSRSISERVLCSLGDDEVFSALWWNSEEIVDQVHKQNAYKYRHLFLEHYMHGPRPTERGCSPFMRPPCT